tara:strand:+ start:3515 stop:3847 length:333 start_codon:yes stop_codon:yes gene_type:complete
MKAKKRGGIMFFTLILFTGCSEIEETGFIQELPIETIKCSHPTSPYEATVEVDIEDETKWENVHLEISQGNRKWETDLQTDDQYVWWTVMQLYELNCYNELETGILYESR